MSKKLRFLVMGHANFEIFIEFRWLQRVRRPTRMLHHFIRETRRREGSTSPSRGKHGWRFTARMQVWFKMASQKSWQLGRENWDFSKSVSSIDSGAIFLPRSGQDLSRNVVVAFLYAFKKNLYCWIGLGHDPENRDFHDFLPFSWNSKMMKFLDWIH